MSLALTIAGCGSSGSGSNDSSAKTIQSGSLDQLVAAAKKEGSVDFYAALDVASAKAINDAFTKKYGIKVNASVLQNDAMDQRMLTEFQHNVHSWDLVSTAVTDNLKSQNDMGMLQPLTPIPSFSDWPQAQQIGDFGVTVGANLYTVLYNSDLVSKADAPTSYDDLLNPKFKGKICGEKPTLNVNIAWQYMVIAQAAKTPDFLTKLGQNKITLTATFADCAQRVGAGESWIGLIAQSYVKSLNGAGAHVTQWIPDTLAGAVRDFAVSKNATHPNAAALFVYFLMTEEGQTVMNGGFGLASPLKNIPGATEFPAGFKPLNAAEATKQASDLLQQLSG
jgi:iron(III) transport system substrate-binding protein